MVKEYSESIIQFFNIEWREMNWRRDINVRVLSHTDNPDRVLSRSIATYRQIEPPRDSRLYNLITKLIKINETSFLEHVYITYEISGITSIGIRHLVRHRIASYSVESQRYVKRFGNYVIPTPDKPEYNDAEALKLLEDHIKQGYLIYHKLMNTYKWKRSYARFAISPCDQHNIICTFNLRSLRNMLQLRLDKKAQEEIRFIAHQMMCLAFDVQLSSVYDLYAKYVGMFPRLYKDGKTSRIESFDISEGDKNV